MTVDQLLRNCIKFEKSIFNHKICLRDLGSKIYLFIDETEVWFGTINEKYHCSGDFEGMKWQLQSEKKWFRVIVNDKVIFSENYQLKDYDQIDKHILEILKTLGDDYILIKGLVNRENSHKKYIKIVSPKMNDFVACVDHIVVSSSGIFLINALRTGDELIIDHDKNWIVCNEKNLFGLMNKKERKGIENPEAGLYDVKQIIMELLQNVEVIPIICITNPKTIIHGKLNSSVPIVKENMLRQYIYQFNRKDDIDIENMANIIEDQLTD